MNLKYTATLCAFALGLVSAVFGGVAFAQSDAEGKKKDDGAKEKQVEIYGILDVSVDDATKGIEGRVKHDGTPAAGRLGWQPDASSNLSTLGLRGFHELHEGLRAVFQLEVQLDITATPGMSQSNFTADNRVQGAWASRNSFVGISGGFGALKVGKTDAPYKTSTARMDPFSKSVGDYNSIMGNTGGDNRAEWDTRLSHSVWYESPKWGGFSFGALWSPGQNRSSDNTINASAEADCTGGNNPGVQGNGPCNDGSFDDAYSLAGVYESGPFYGIVAYELHKNVNRTGDESANGGDSPDGSIGIVNEYAWKAGIQYTFRSKTSTKTTANFIFEKAVRHAPDPNFNERDRPSAWWAAVSQKVTAEDELNFGWAHAGKTPGDVGTNRADGSHATGPVDNRANMIAVGYKHYFANKPITCFLVYARQMNHNGAHYDLGASGHGVTTDCHDGTPNGGGSCFAGSTLQAVSVGMGYNFSMGK